jgi:DNA-binding SARP family transcriptional activator/tetratricopeptide (TPR) repeat protein
VLPDGAIGSRKARTLLALLAVERRQRVPVERIVDVLWAGAPPATAERTVASLVSRLRSALGAGIIEGGGRLYRLGRGPGVVVDLDEAARLCDRADHQHAVGPALAVAAAQRVLDMLSAETALADHPYAAWADPAREEVRVLLRRARLTAAAAALATGAAQAAMDHAGQALAADPLDEPAHRQYMAAAAAAGEPAKALAAYAALSSRLGDELGTDPAPQTRELHLAILREQEPAGHVAHDPGPRGAPPSLADGPGQGETGVVGRESELSVLRGGWRSAADGEPGVALIVGEAGIGKTTLARRIAAEAAADGAIVLRARCYETERSLFLQPIVEALTPAVAALPAAELRALAGEHAPALAALLPASAPLLGPPPSWHGSIDTERRRAFEAALAVLCGLARRLPVLLFIDDLHNAGRSTVEFLHYLGRHAADARLLALATLRAEYEDQVGAALVPVMSTRIELGPLSLAAVEHLARAAGQAHLAGRILKRTGGHALFVVEVLRALAAGEADGGVPESLRAAITERVRRAGPATEALLRAAAVLGAAVDPLVLAGLLDLPPARVLELCEAVTATRLLVVAGRDYEFANDLIREALYETTPEPVQLAHHRRAADLLTGQPESLARHAAAFGDWPRAARALLLAAENAMRRYAASDAITLATQALEAAQRAPHLDGGRGGELAARALFIRGRAQETVGEQPAAFADLSEAVAGARAAGDSRLEMLVLRELGGDVPAALGQPVTGYVANLERGLRIAESAGDRAAQASFLSRLAVLAVNQLRYDRALDYALRAMDVARATGDDQALAAGLDGLKTVRAGLGDVPGLRGVLDELGPVLRRSGDLYLLVWAEFESAYPFVAAADWAAAEKAIRAAVQLNDRTGYRHWASWYVAHLGWLARLRGRDEEALEHGRQAVDMSQRYPHEWLQAGTRAMLGSTLLAVGDRQAAVQVLEAGLEAASYAGMPAYLLHCLAPLAAATGSQEVLDQATAALDAATFPKGGAWVLGDESYLSIARAWLSKGEPDRARAVLAPLLAVVADVPWLPAYAAALAVDGQALRLLGQGEQARAAFGAARDIATRHGLPHVLREIASFPA